MFHWKMWCLIGRCGGSLGDVVSHWEMWWLIWISGGSLEDVVAHFLIIIIIIIIVYLPLHYSLQGDFFDKYR